MDITRGDTFDIKFQRKNKNKEVIKEQPDKMYFTVKQDDNTVDTVFQKTLGDGSISFDSETYYYNLTIEPEDTNDLDYGTYYYDIEVIIGTKVKTIAKGTINITSEITFSVNEV